LLVIAVGQKNLLHLDFFLLVFSFSGFTSLALSLLFLSNLKGFLRNVNDDLVKDTQPMGLSDMMYSLKVDDLL